MTNTDAVIERACTRKVRFEGPGEARGAAAAHRRAGEDVSHYRCPFCGHWHVGHVPSLAAMSDLAAAIRDRNGNQPTPPTLEGHPHG